MSIPRSQDGRTATAVLCMTCRHRSQIDAAALARFGVKADAPIASYVKRLRCSHCGSGNVIARRVRAAETRLRA
jgi:hypothetical protein